jgi:subtilisin family serine protease
MLLVLLAPMVSGFHAPPSHLLPQGGLAEGHERLLLLDEGQWTSAQWAMLVEHGIQPLRSIAPEALLVWGDGPLPGALNAKEVEFDDARYLQPLNKIGSGPLKVKVVFEPRLPFEALQHLQNALIDMGGLVEEVEWGVGSLPGHITVAVPEFALVDRFLERPGVLWIEPVLTTQARNGPSASTLQNGNTVSEPFWALGINGSGVVLGVADSGVDADHACFRNATDDTSPHAEPGAPHPAVGTFGDDHRKIIHLNTTVDGNDTPGDSDYRHGTHVIGSLGCHDVDAYRNGLEPSNGTTLAHGAKLVIQDIVSSEGWQPPPVDELLWEASTYGAVIHSNSWGDDTTAYTERTGRFDGYARAMPWSVALIAPGNSGEGVLEPANGRNVVAVSASANHASPERWGSTSYGPTESGTDGIFLLAPGASVSSAAADGFWNTNNNNLRTSSGTSMATPLAAGTAGLIQQLYEEGWIVGPRESLQPTLIESPVWLDGNTTETALLGNGFTPSGSLLRASLALAAAPLNETVRNGGEGGHQLHNPYDGWGLLNLSQIINIDHLAPESSPSPSLWVHDSYRLVDGDVATWFDGHGSQANNLAGFTHRTWNGEGAAGPFLQTGDEFRHRFTPQANEHVRIRLAFPAQPEPALVDDLQLRVVLEDGTVLIPDHLQADGAPTQFYGTVADFNNTEQFPNSNETVVGIDVPASYLNGSSWFDVSVVARYVQPGGVAGSVGLDGDAVGFALVVQGVDRDSADHLDGDGDGVANIDDLCPLEDASQADENKDGCLDDNDGDGIVNPLDRCPNIDASGYDSDGDGCLDDADNDGVTDDVDACETTDLAWPVNTTGCYPLDDRPTLRMNVVPESNAPLNGIIDIEWIVEDGDGDETTIVFSWVLQEQPNITLVACSQTVMASVAHACSWTFPDDLPALYRRGEAYDLRATLQTTNASPAAFSEAIELTIAINRTVPMLDADVPGDEEQTNGGYDLLSLGLIGMLVGVAFMRFLRSRPSAAMGGKPPPPFEVGANDESH